MKDIQVQEASEYLGTRSNDAPSTEIEIRSHPYLSYIIFGYRMLKMKRYGTILQIMLKSVISGGSVSLSLSSATICGKFSLHGET